MHAALDLELLISRVDRILDPVAELLAQNGERNAGDPLLRHLPHFLLIREVVEGLRPLSQELIQPVDGQGIVLRYLQVRCL